ncbi:DUF6932 family protein [Spirosoma foliorum]|uniref:Uncharacterized protein n=1 Tax=Spirosoma foliorum TaxID=2710596 RepID=A0A7G5GXC4_9BACT|nr:hypothetical protein [Spirosoma foliorum]QMW03516.1 hypothetical protein H3H32_00675 [Spirosoma foliorum]
METVLSFTDNGLLTPNEAIEVTTSIFYERFVALFSNSSTRVQLFNEWLKYNKLLRSEIGQDFVQWIDGSFVTLKQNPKDIDLVSFIPYQLYNLHHHVLDNLWSDKWEREGLDAYFVTVYPENHPAFTHKTKQDREQWMTRYSLTKPDDTFVQHSKGFLTIQIQ